MCGICGVVQIGGEPRQVVAPEVLDRMTDIMVHRGPNDRGTYSAPGIALGVRRLSIVDVAGGHQPVANEAGDVWAIQNGELYNHVALRDDLVGRGHSFHSRCDTEVLPHLYESFGPSFPERLRGKFGLAVWDGQRRAAVVARDRLGVKPLYYAQRGDLVVFGSELKSVLASGLVDPELDYGAIDALLSFGFVPGPLTPLAGVRKLMPGHRLVIDAGGARSEPYWRYPKPDVTRDGAGVDDYAAGLLARLEESVRLRLMSDVPLGAMLSGGLDSSLIVALMARNMRDPVKTFSVGFVEDRETNELADARLVAQALGADHHELELSFSDTEVDLPTLVWHLDEPVADLSALGFLALSELAARHVTVALCGQGADELFGGYRKHRAAALVGAWLRMPGAVRRPAARVARHGPRRARRAAAALAAPDPVERLLAMSGKLGGDLRARLLRGPLAHRNGDVVRATIASRLDGVADDPLPVTLYLDGQLALVDDMLHFSDRSSMAHSLEVRVPFLDHELVEYCAGIPGAYKVRRQQTKYVLKHAARGLIPDEIIDKRKIGFFNRPVEDWFRAQTDGVIAEFLLAPQPVYADMLDRSVVEELVRDHAAGNGSAHPHLLLTVLMLEVWLSTFLPRALAVPEPARLPVPA